MHVTLIIGTATAVLALAGSASAGPAVWSPVGAGCNGPVLTMVATDLAGGGSKLVVGGSFTSAGGNTTLNVATWNGGSWSALGTQITNGEVRTLLEFPINGQRRLIAGGSFLLSSSPFALWGAGGWQAMANEPFFWTSGLGVYDAPGGPQLFATSGVSFSNGSGYIGKLNAGATAWEPAGRGLITVTGAYATLTDASGTWFYAGAGAQVVGGLSMVARWNGTEWQNPPGMPGNASGTVEAMCVWDDGAGPALYMGGTFTNFGAPTGQRGIVRYKNGVISSVGGGVNGSVGAMCVFDDGDGPALYVGGKFTLAGSVSASNIARFRNGAWEALGAGLTGTAPASYLTPVQAMAVFDEDGPGPKPAALFVGGWITSAGGQSVSNIAKFGRSVCVADCAGLGGTPGGDGRVSIDDLVYYLASFFGGAGGLSVADIAHVGGAPGPDGVVGADDLIAFLATFFAGCP
jgi:hypothetical protein